MSTLKKALALTGCTGLLMTLAVVAAGCTTPEQQLFLVEADAGAESYPFCRIDEPGACQSVTERNHRGTYGFSADGCEEACQCRNMCQSDVDCPAPSSGSSSPACVGGSCVLPCDDPETMCPDGMVCTEDATREVWWCMWITQSCR